MKDRKEVEKNDEKEADEKEGKGEKMKKRRREIWRE